MGKRPVIAMLGLVGAGIALALASGCCTNCGTTRPKYDRPAFGKGTPVQPPAPPASLGDAKGAPAGGKDFAGSRVPDTGGDIMRTGGTGTPGSGLPSLPDHGAPVDPKALKQGLPAS